MEKLMIEKTKSTPYINFDADMALLQIMGESYPENVTKFYTPILNWIKEYFEQSEKATTMEFEITYFNSSTSKVFMTIFDFLDQEVQKGKDVIVKWRCDIENETAIECGEEFQEDVEDLTFIIETFET